MGLSESIFFITYFIKNLIINIIHTFFNALIVHGVLEQSQYGYLFLIFFFFGLVIFSMTYFFQSFQQKSRKGVIMSLLFYCIIIHLNFFSLVLLFFHWRYLIDYLGIIVHYFFLGRYYYYLEIDFEEIIL